MGILNAIKDKPEILQFLAHATQGLGRPGGMDVAGGMQILMDARNRREREGQYRGLLDDMSSAAQPTGASMDMGGGVSAQPVTHGTPAITEQQRGILQMLPPEQGMGLLAERAFAQPEEKDRRIIKGADGFNYFADTGERVLPNIAASSVDSAAEYGVSPLYYQNPDGSIGVAQLSKQGGAQPVRGLPEGAIPVRPAMRVGGGLYDPLSAQRRTDVTGDIASGKAAETEGSAVGTARTKIPMAEADTKVALETIKRLRTHPGRVHGWGARVPDWAVNPNSKEMEFRLLNEQARNQTFIQAFQRLKGGGHITEIEGTKASEAMERLERAQSRESYTRALADLERIYKIGLARARREAKMGGGSPSAPPGTPADEGSIDSLIDQYRSR